jgi:hypothetical protein
MTPYPADPQPGIIPRYTLVQAVAEVGVGSIAHALQLPLTGHLLSLNQALILTFTCRATDTRTDAIRAATAVSTSTALLKALSPAGKRLTPMLAIGVQGLLYAVGPAVLGRTLLGAAFGASLLSLWAFLQPLLIAYLLLGSVFFEAVLKLWSDVSLALSLPEDLGLHFLLAIVIAKATIAALLAGAAWISGDELEERYLRRVRRVAQRAKGLRKPKSRLPAWKGALHDLLSPWFVLSVALTLVFFAMSGPDGATRAVWFALRTLAAALLFFWAVRALPQKWVKSSLSRFPRVSAAVEYTLAQLR